MTPAPARTLMIQGTASSVGKSLLCAALCRMLKQEGVRVAPFKAWNMSNNAYVTIGGHEMARAQAVQAAAAGLPPSADMNPVLLKPEGARGCQVVLQGRSIGTLSLAEQRAARPRFEEAIASALGRLRAAHDVVVIEGAGSAAEPNLRDADLANMHVARLADAPVLVVGDIEHGGVFASLFGTLALLRDDDRARVRGLVINRMRGDAASLAPAIDELERRGGVPVLGVLPFLDGVRLPDEDAAGLQSRRRRAPAGAGELDVCVAFTPHISNFDDYLPLENEPGVVVRFVSDADEARGADLLVLPGSKSTVADLAWLRASGLAELAQQRARRGLPVLGICGGCQMLGSRIDDPLHVESDASSTEGLGLLPLRTRFERAKVTALARARVRAPSFLTDGRELDEDLFGYEIHCGMVEPDSSASVAFDLLTRNGASVRVPDGAVGAGGLVVGTLLHGILENDAVRDSLLAFLRRRKGIPAPAPAARAPEPQAVFDALADWARRHLEGRRLRALLS